jgi:hypothetical protein
MGESSFTPPPLIINDGIVKSMDMKLRFPDASKALHPSSLRRTSKYASFLRISAPRLRIFLR